MPEFAPVTSVAAFAALDEADVLLGYMDGFEGLNAPGSGHSRGYAHGWRNGMIDAGRMQSGAADRVLAEAFRQLGSTPKALHPLNLPDGPDVRRGLDNRPKQVMTNQNDTHHQRKPKE